MTPLEAVADQLTLSFIGHWEGKTIDAIKFDESGPYSDIELYRLIQIRPGDPFQARLTREAVRRLYQTEQFKSVWVTVAPTETDHIALKIHWTKNQLLTSIAFSGNRHLSDEALLKTIGVKAGDWFSRMTFERGLANLKTLYRQKGYFQTEISPDLIFSSGKQAGVDIRLKVREGARTKIRKVSFWGETIYAPWRLNLKIYSKKGEYYLLDALQEDVRRLTQFYEDKGYFRVVVGPTRVSYREKTNEVDVAFLIQPAERLDVIFEGGKLYDPDVLEPLLLFKKERSLAPGVLEASARQVTQFYLSEGYPFAKTTARIEASPETKQVSVYFTIESGPRAVLETLRFSGHYAFLKAVLLEQIGLSESGRFQKSYYSEASAEAAATALTLFYREEGFNNVSVTPEVVFYDEGRAAALHFKVDEGARTRFARIDFAGNHALDNSELEHALKIFPQDPFTREKVRLGRRAILSAYARAGYLQAEIIPEVHISLGETDAEVTYHVKEGDQTLFGEVTLEGNEKTRNRVILRALRIRPGEPYNPEAILESQRRLYKTGHFSSVRFDPVQEKESRDSAKHEADQAKGPRRQNLKLTVVERSRIALDFGAGYGDRERFRGFIGLTHQNLFGTGHSLTGRMERSRVEERYFLIHRKPWFFDESITARTTASYFRDDEVSFDLETFSLVTGVEKRFSPRLTGALLYQIERKKTTNVPEQAELTAEDEDTYTIGSLNPSLLYDTRDDPFNPKSGSVTSLVVRDAAKILASDVQLVKVTLQRRSYHSISRKLVFAFSGRMGVAERFGETENIPIPERFFIGGRNTVRGYDEDELGVDGVTLLPDPGQPGSAARVPVGGNTMLVFNEELRYDFPKSFGLVFFLDHGNVWPRYKNIKLSEIKSTVGLGIRYNTPIGPFRLDWGYKLDRESFENASAFHFTLGHAF